jgi:hypothetical protein
MTALWIVLAVVVVLAVAVVLCGDRAAQPVLNTGTLYQ